MTNRSALLIGIESPLTPQAPGLTDDLGAAVQALGFTSVYRTPARPSVAEVLAARDAWLASFGADDVAIVWVCGPATDGELVLADGTLTVADLTDGAPSVRSVLRIFDIPGAVARPSGDPTLVAASGAPIGGAVTRALAGLPASATFQDLCARIGDAVALTFEPTTSAQILLAALLDGGPAHVPWRGVDAWYEVEQGWEFPFSGGQLGFTASQEQWSFAGQPFPNMPLTGTWRNQLGPRAPVQFNFTNQGFTNPAPVRPDIQPGDQAYQLVSPGMDLTFLIVRGVANPSQVAWYTSQPNTRYLTPTQGAPGTLQPLTQGALNALWTQAPGWWNATETPA